MLTRLLSLCFKHKFFITYLGFLPRHSCWRDFYPCDLNIMILSLILDFTPSFILTGFLSSGRLPLKEITLVGVLLVLFSWKRIALNKNCSVDAWPVLFVLAYKKGLQGYKLMETQEVLKMKYWKGNETKCLMKNWGLAYLWVNKRDVPNLGTY